MDAHIFIDSSNLFGGAQRAAEKLEPEALWLAVRIYYRNFFALIEKGFTAKTKIMGGSIPPGNDDLWEYSRKAGYNTDLLRRVETDDGRLVEQGVDEVMHLKIANALLDYEPPQTLIIVTGDGAPSDFGTSFLKQAERAMKRGWDVVIWSWSAQLSGSFQRLPRPTGRTLTVKELDQYYKSITFVKSDTYQVGMNTVTIAGRVVSPLRG